MKIFHFAFEIDYINVAFKHVCLKTLDLYYVYSIIRRIFLPSKTTSSI